MKIRLCYRLEKEIGMAEDEQGNPSECYVCCQVDVKKDPVPRKQYKENWTRFKVGVKQIHTIPPKILLALGEPTKKTTRFYYWEKKGDFING